MGCVSQPDGFKELIFGHSFSNMDSALTKYIFKKTKSYFHMFLQISAQIHLITSLSRANTFTGLLSNLVKAQYASNVRQ